MGWNIPTHVHTVKTSEPNKLVLHHKTVNTQSVKVIKNYTVLKIGFSHENDLIETDPLIEFNS